MQIHTNIRLFLLATLALCAGCGVVTKSNVHRKRLYNGIKVSSHSNCDTIILFIQRDILNFNVILPVIESKAIFRALN